MKKISLKSLNLKEVEKLSREQLKNIMGGWTGSSTNLTSQQTIDENCATVCQNPGDDCQTADCEEGTCGIRSASIICIKS